MIFRICGVPKNRGRTRNFTAKKNAKCRSARKFCQTEFELYGKRLCFSYFSNFGFDGLALQFLCAKSPVHRYSTGCFQSFLLSSKMPSYMLFSYVFLCGVVCVCASLSLDVLGRLALCCFSVARRRFLAHLLLICTAGRKNDNRHKNASQTQAERAKTSKNTHKITPTITPDAREEGAARRT